MKVVDFTNNVNPITYIRSLELKIENVRPRKILLISKSGNIDFFSLRNLLKTNISLISLGKGTKDVWQNVEVKEYLLIMTGFFGGCFPMFEVKKRVVAAHISGISDMRTMSGISEISNLSTHREIPLIPGRNKYSKFGSILLLGLVSFLVVAVAAKIVIRSSTSIASKKYKTRSVAKSPSINSKIRAKPTSGNMLYAMVNGTKKVRKKSRKRFRKNRRPKKSDSVGITGAGVAANIDSSANGAFEMESADPIVLQQPLSRKTKVKNIQIANLSKQDRDAPNALLLSPLANQDGETIRLKSLNFKKSDIIGCDDFCEVRFYGANNQPFVGIVTSEIDTDLLRSTQGLVSVVGMVQQRGNESILYIKDLSSSARIRKAVKSKLKNNDENLFLAAKGSASPKVQFQKTATELPGKAVPNRDTSVKGRSESISNRTNRIPSSVKKAPHAVVERNIPAPVNQNIDSMNNRARKQNSVRNTRTVNQNAYRQQPLNLQTSNDKKTVRKKRKKRKKNRLDPVLRKLHGIGL